MDEPDWDRGPDGKQEGVLYTPNRKLKVDVDGRAGTNWSTTAMTVDHFKYPNDLRTWDRGLDRDNVFVRYVNGKKFMIVAGGGSAGKPLSVYRFEPGSEIAIPCAAYGPSAQNAQKFPGQPESGEWFWTDQNRDGQYGADEFATRKIPYVKNDKFDGMPFYGLNVDTNGGLWMTHNERFVRYFIPTEKDGILSYSFDNSRIWKIPTEFNKNAGRMSYDAPRDVMYLTGPLPESAWTMVAGDKEKPDSRLAGNAIVRFDGWLKSAPADARPDTLIDPPKATWVQEIPFDSTRNIDRHAAMDMPVMMTAEGDYVFMGYARIGRIRVYRADTGQFVGIWELGPSMRIEDQSKNDMLSNSPLNYGLMDSPIGLRVMHRADGSYVLTYHDNFLSHTALYVWRPNARPTAPVWDLKAALVGTPDKPAVELTWTPAEGAKSYQIERLLASGAETWTIIVDNVTESHYSDTTGLKPGVTALYRLRTRAANGDWSDYSNVKYAR